MRGYPKFIPRNQRALIIEVLPGSKIPFSVDELKKIAKNGYYKYLSQKKLSDYSNCYENVELKDGSRKIVMTETLDEFISEKQMI